MGRTNKKSKVCVRPKRRRQTDRKERYNTQYVEPKEHKKWMEDVVRRYETTCSCIQKN